MLTKTFGSAVQGVNAYTITIEVVVSQGTGCFVVGLPDNAIKESQQRVEAALKFRGYRMPRTKVVVNMAPAWCSATSTKSAARCWTALICT